MHKATRRRGVILSQTGQHKLQEARRQSEIQENFGDRYTLEELSDRTRLSLSTITKVLEAQIGVDKQTLDAFFSAFGLQLERSDYTQPDFGAKEQGNTNRDNPPVVAPQQGISPEIQNLKSKIQNHTDWGEAVDVSLFYGISALGKY